MPDDARIEIVIDPSLLDHFRDHLRNRNSSMTPEEAITGLVAMILDGSTYPVEAKKTGDREIRLGYQLRSFSQPIFWN